jgi:dTDP-4-dehydrorhamnose 3,5-epimerase
LGRTVTGTVSIAGVELTPLRQIEDARGAVLHMLRADSPGFAGFGECYFSQVNPGSVKAWKRHQVQTQNLAVPTGRVRFVIYDARESSHTHGRTDVIELGRPDCYARLCIPPMLYYGFACMSASAALIANCADRPHDPAESESLAPEALAQGGPLSLLLAGLTS